MHLRRPVAAVLTALALFGGAATLTGCEVEAAGAGQRDGTTDDEVNEGPGPGPNYTDPEREVEQGEDQQDPD